ncbi:MAG: hypothetical protein NT126_09460 [Bacteroidetes bacterium]|nr:hypothetical protein [Bacteroidota bacterium]
MLKHLLKAILTALFIVSGFFASASGDSTKVEKKQDYQIFLKHPAKEIRLLMYEKNFLPIQGKLSEDRQSVILKDYQFGNKVRVKVIYEDGTEDEFVKSPCYIDPVVL